LLKVTSSEETIYLKDQIAGGAVGPVINSIFSLGEATYLRDFRFAPTSNAFTAASTVV
jgi:hypothetical protein